MKAKLYICYIYVKRHRSNSCMLFGWWFNLWEPKGSRSVYSWSSYRVLIPLGACNSSPYSSIRVPKYKKRKMQRQVDFWVQGQPGLQSEFQDSQGYTEKPCLGKKKKKEYPSTIHCLAVGVCICLNQLLGRSSQRDWCLPMGWISSWASYWLAITSVSVSSPFLHFL
jgi:hypothetical protein